MPNRKRRPAPGEDLGASQVSVTIPTITEKASKVKPAARGWMITHSPGQ